ncbi:hypothetical protein AUK05_00370 [Candidatus Shapirobacteria bacterium CG2_30_35_20]|uniref:SCP domain-containing protein n=3 Tax=Candidatus Shapironibacteriota TaxID=1752721 RepID=A0A1J5HRS7_9BACT|nr:MAG: hypothetical protein AUK05_00370 [Candidatus Shapirobacteria bacterium CG2_30_35_20]
MFKKFSHYFLPYPDNNHRALLLQPSFLALFVAVYLLNQSFIKSFTIARPGVLGYSSEITISKVLDQTNTERVKLGLKPLTFNSTLSKSAQLKADDMFTNNYWAHTSPEGKSPWDFFNNAGYEYSVAGENLAKDFYDTEGLLKAWMNSPTHRENIINPKYQEIGIGVVNGILGGVKTTLVVQHFGTPRNGVVLASVPPDDIAVESSFIQNIPIASPIQLNKIFAMIMFVFIICLLIVDSYITLKNKTPRLTGSSAGHIGFLLIILLLLIFTHQGTIF